MTIKIDRFDHLVLTVADIDKTCDFYVRVLGMRKEIFGTGRVALHFNQQKINLHPKERSITDLVAAKADTGSADVCFITTQPIALVISHLNHCVVPIIEGPVARTGAMGVITSVYIRDPDGNLIEVSTYTNSTK